MWVTSFSSVKPSGYLFFTWVQRPVSHSFSHSLKSLNSPLTWGYLLFPQVNALVTTTTYNYIKTPVRFPLINFKNFQLLKIKNLQSFTTAGRLTK